MDGMHEQRQVAQGTAWIMKFSFKAVNTTESKYENHYLTVLFSSDPRSIITVDSFLRFFLSSPNPYSILKASVSLPKPPLLLKRPGTLAKDSLPLLPCLNIACLFLDLAQLHTSQAEFVLSSLTTLDRTMLAFPESLVLLEH